MDAWHVQKRWGALTFRARSMWSCCFYISTGATRTGLVPDWYLIDISIWRSSGCDQLERDHVVEFCNILFPAGPSWESSTLCQNPGGGEGCQAGIIAGWTGRTGGQEKGNSQGEEVRSSPESQIFTKTFSCQHCDTEFPINGDCPGKDIAPTFS